MVALHLPFDGWVVEARWLGCESGCSVIEPLALVISVVEPPIFVVYVKFFFFFILPQKLENILYLKNCYSEIRAQILHP